MRSKKDPRFIVESPISWPPVGLLTVGKPEVYISSAASWYAHSSSIIRFAVHDRPAPGELGIPVITLLIPFRYGNSISTSSVVPLNIGPSHPAGNFFRSATSPFMYRKITSDIRLISSFASSSFCDNAITVRPGKHNIIHTATCNTSHVMPNCLAFNITVSLFPNMLANASFCAGHILNGCTISNLSFSSMCPYVSTKYSGLSRQYSICFRLKSPISLILINLLRGATTLIRVQLLPHSKGREGRQSNDLQF